MKKEPMTLERLGGIVEKLTTAFEGRFDAIDKRFDTLEGEVRGLGVLMEDVDAKFTAITEGQDVIREVLEHRVAHIEEILEVQAA